MDSSAAASCIDGLISMDVYEIHAKYRKTRGATGRAKIRHKNRPRDMTCQEWCVQAKQGDEPRDAVSRKPCRKPCRKQRESTRETCRTTCKVDMANAVAHSCCHCDDNKNIVLLLLLVLLLADSVGAVPFARLFLFKGRR
jgi:hypothetical protein